MEEWLEKIEELQKGEHNFYILKIDGEFILTYREFECLGNINKIKARYYNINDNGEIVYGTFGDDKPTKGVTVIELPHTSLASAQNILYKLTNKIYTEPEKVKELFKARK